MDEEQRKLLESLSRLTNATDEYGSKLQAQIDNYNVLLASENKEAAARAKSEIIITKTNQAYNDQMRALGLVKNSLGEFERITANLTKEQKQRLAQEEVISKQLRAKEEMSAKMQGMLADKTGSLLKGLSAFGEGLNKTVFDSTKGQSKYGEAMSSFGSGIIDVTKNLGPLGKAAGFAAGALFKVAGAALKQQEQLNKAYEKLSEFGAVDVGGIDQMFKNLQNAGMTVAELDKFADVLKSAGPSLATIGTTTADGAKKFADTMLNIKNSGAERELRMLGFTSESIAKTFVDYQGMMARQGALQGKSTAQIAKESERYAKNLDELAKLTGQTRDEMQKNMDAASNDLRVRSRMRELELKGQGDLAAQLRNASAMAEGFGPEVASGMKEMIATGGKVLTDAGANLMISTGGKAAEIFKQLNEKTITAEEAMNKISIALIEQQDKYLTTSQILDANNNALGQNAKALDEANKYINKTPEAIEKLRKDQELQGKGQLDDQRRTEVQRQMTERNLEQAKDRLTNMVGKVMVNAFEALLKVINSLGKGLSAIVKWFGGPDLTDLFTSAEEMQDSLKKTSNELDKTNKRIEELGSKTNLSVRERNELLNLERQKKKLEKEQLEQSTKLTQTTGTSTGGGSRSSMGGYLQKVAQVESSGLAGAQAKGSTAAGLFQFTEGTWKQVTKQMGKNYSLEDRFDPAKAAEVAQFFTAQQSGQLEKALGRQPNDAELYMAHFLGAGGALRFLSAMAKNPNAPASDGASSQQIEANKSIFYTEGGKGKLRSLEEVYQMMSGKLESAGQVIAQGKGGADIGKIQLAQFGGLFSGPESGYPVMMHGREMVIPMPNAGNLASVLDTVQKTALTDQPGSDRSTSFGNQAMMDQFITLQTDLMNLIANKLDMLDSRLAKSNDIQSDILTYSSS